MTDDRFENPYYKPNEDNSDASADTISPQSYYEKPAEAAQIQEQIRYSEDTQDTINAEVSAENDCYNFAEPADVSNNFSQPAGYSQIPSEPQLDTLPQQAPYQPNPQPQPQSHYSYEWYGSNQRASYSQPPQVPQTVKQPKGRSGVSKGMFFGGIAICLCLSFVFGFAGTWVYDNLGSGIKSSNSNGVTINQVESSSGSGDNYDSGLSTVEIVNKTADSVVEITTETVKTGVFAQQYIDSGAGSGVIVDAKGIIVTNHHVIDGATKISVSLRDGTTYNATLLGSDAELDVALLEITPDKTLTAAIFGDSSTLMVGQRTVAIGNPLGQLGGSVTEGIISALNRDVVIDGQTMSLLQTDTAINPGNSGGGLFDSNGNLIGIVNAKSSGSEIEGLGFAIPINDVIDVIGDLSEYGYVRGRVDLGVTFIDVESEQVAWMYRLDKTGCYIYSVEENRNADKAGLVSGDRVISVNGTAIENSEDIESIIANCSVGENVTFEVESTAGKTHKVSFKLEEYVPEKKNENFFDNSGGSPDDFSYWWSYYE